MILKKIKRASFDRPKNVMIRKLVDYVFSGHDHAGREKLAFGGGMNFLTETLAAQRNEMIALAGESVRSRMPVTHWIMSWREDEIPDRAQVEEAVGMFLRGMELEGHQAFYAAHGNTGNVHVHIVVNRTHPVTHRVIQPHRGFDIEAAHRIVAEIESRQGWEPQENARYVIDGNGEAVRNTGAGRTPKPRAEAEDFENATGEKSAQRIAQERGRDIIGNARTWRELHEGLAAVGLRFERKGSGGIIFVGDVAVKASSVDRRFGLSKLCRRLGGYEAGSYPPAASIPPELASHVCAEEWHAYRRELEAARERRTAERKTLAGALEAAAAGAVDRRVAALAKLAGYGLSILNIARHCLKLEEREGRRKAGEAAPEGTPLPRRFKHWLAERDIRLAALWRFRRRIAAGLDVGRRMFPRLGRLAGPLAAYRDAVAQRIGTWLPPSKRDAVAALWLRCAGYSREEVAAELGRHAPAPSPEDCGGIDVRRRIIGAAFGVAGDIEIAKIAPTPERIRAFVAEVEGGGKREIAPAPSDRQDAAGGGMPDAHMERPAPDEMESRREEDVPRTAPEPGMADTPAAEAKPPAAAEDQGGQERGNEPGRRRRRRLR